MGDIITFPRGIYWPDVLAHGCSGIVGRLDAVIKFPLGKDNNSHIDIERSIYERIDNKHVGILKFYGSLGNGIVLEYAPHGCITAYLQNTVPETSLRARWIQQTVQAVSFIHSKYILHRDIHCNNIFLDSELNAKLGDFAGSSLDGSTQVGCYSPRHDHPSLSGLTIKREIFALGSTIYHILKGAQPYEELGDAEVKRRYIAGEYPSVESLGSFGHIVLRCWLTEYESVDDILKDVES